MKKMTAQQVSPALRDAVRHLDDFSFNVNRISELTLNMRAFTLTDREKPPTRAEVAARYRERLDEMEERLWRAREAVDAYGRELRFLRLGFGKRPIWNDLPRLANSGRRYCTGISQRLTQIEAVVSWIENDYRENPTALKSAKARELWSELMNRLDILLKHLQDGMPEPESFAFPGDESGENYRHRVNSVANDLADEFERLWTGGGNEREVPTERRTSPSLADNTERPSSEPNGV